MSNSEVKSQLTSLLRLQCYYNVNNRYIIEQYRQYPHWDTVVIVLCSSTLTSSFRCEPLTSSYKQYDIT